MHVSSIKQRFGAVRVRKSHGIAREFTEAESVLLGLIVKEAPLVVALR